MLSGTSSDVITELQYSAWKRNRSAKLIEESLRRRSLTGPKLALKFSHLFLSFVPPYFPDLFLRVLPLLLQEFVSQ
jgi:hypothetical protein